MIAVQAKFWWISKWSFVALCVLATIGVTSTIFVPSFTPEREGCFWTDAMLPYIACPNVPVGRAIAFLLNLPFLVFFYSYIIAFYLIGSGEIASTSFAILWKFILSLICIALTIVGGAYPLRWSYEKFKSR